MEKQSIVMKNKCNIWQWSRGLYCLCKTSHTLLCSLIIVCFGLCNVVCKNMFIVEIRTTTTLSECRSHVLISRITFLWLTQASILMLFLWQIQEAQLTPLTLLYQLLICVLLISLNSQRRTVNDFVNVFVNEFPCFFNCNIA